MRCCSTRASPGSPATSATSATPRPSISVAPARSGSSPTPNTPWTCSPAARQRGARSRCPCGCGEPLRPPHPRRPGSRPGRGLTASWPPILMRPRVLSRSRDSARSPPSCSPTGSPGSQQPAPRSPCAPSSTSTPPTGPWTSTTHPKPCAKPSVLRDAHCVFPGCARDSRTCDLDHVTEYLPMEDGGPPGQTRTGNLAPLCRSHHRTKTHTEWRYKRHDNGSYGWTAPTGHQYTVAPTLLCPRDLPRPHCGDARLRRTALGLVSSARPAPSARFC